MTRPRGSTTNPTLKKRSFRSGCLAFACAMTNASYSFAILPSASVSSPGMSIAHSRGKVEAREPGGGLHEVREVVEVDLDVLALADPPDGGDQTDGGVGLDHARSLSRRVHAARLSWCRVRHALSRRPRSSITRTATGPPRFRTVTSWRGNAETSIAARDATCSERTSRQRYSFVSCSRRLATWTVSPTAVR